MDAIEKAIRHAFEKGNAEGRSYREKVYRSAFAALERTMQGRGDLSDEAKNLRREGLKQKITEIESEFVPAVEPAQPSGSPEPSPDISRPDEDFIPRVEREERAVPAPDAASMEVDSDRKRASGGRRSFAMMYLIVTLLAFVGIGIWWTLDRGLLRSSSERDTSVPNPPRVLEEESFAGDEQQAGPERRATGEWITVFTPSDPATVSAPGGATAEVQEDDEDSYLRISAPGDGAVVFDVGQGVLQALAGRRAIFNIDARSNEGQETQVSVACQFGPLGDCGRRRYVVGPSRADYLFEVEFSDANPGSAGSISIVPDLQGEGRVLDIYSIRAAPAE